MKKIQEQVQGLEQQLVKLNEEGINSLCELQIEITKLETELLKLSICLLL